LRDASLLHFTEEPSASGIPTALDGGRRDSQKGGRVFDGKAREVAEFDDLALLGIQGGKFVEGGVQRKQINGGLWGLRQIETALYRNRMDAGTPLGGATAPFIVHEDPTHELRGDAQEVGAILDRKSFLPREAQIDFVDQSGSLKRVIGPLLAKVMASDAAEFAIDERKNTIERIAVKGSPIER
jgi:hypothetical protein